MILAIDPGPQESAFVAWDGGLMAHAKWANEALVRAIRNPSSAFHTTAADKCVIEMIASYGMPVGKEVFETCVWIGRFMEAFGAERCVRIPRLAVKSHLCHSAKAKDSNIRQALIDRLGGPKELRMGGKLYKVVKDEWAALALAITFAEMPAAVPIP